jgi:hypothetical protein
MEPVISTKSKNLFEYNDELIEENSGKEKKNTAIMKPYREKNEQDSIKNFTSMTVKTNNISKKNDEFKKPAFLTGMLLDKKSRFYFGLTKQDIYGGGGKIALWIRHSLLTHLRDHNIEDKFLSSLSTTSQEGLKLLWKEVLLSLGVPPDEMDEKVDKLVDETGWVALVLVKEKGRNLVIGQIDKAIGLMKEVCKNDANTKIFTGILLNAGKDEEKKQILKVIGMEEGDIEKVCALFNKKDKSSISEVVEIIKNHAEKTIKILEDVKKEIEWMDLGKFNPLLDFKQQVESVLKDAGCMKGKDDFLSLLVKNETKEAKVNRIISKSVKIASVIVSLVGFSYLTTGVVAAGSPLIHEIAWEAFEFSFHGLELSPEFFEYIESQKREGVMKSFGIVKE